MLERCLLKSLRDYIALTKPRLNFLAVLTALAGFYMASPRPMDLSLLFFTMLGTIGVAGGCGALNQWLETESDKRMVRTQRRPLPAGRLSTAQAFWFGLGLSIAGLLILAFQVNELTAFLGLCALVSYLLLYTPLKKLTSLCTVVGAVPGAIPPMMGWAAVQDRVGPEGWALFAILFLWQMPHALALGWIYREDYAKAGMPMLAVEDPQGSTTGFMAVAYAFALWPAALLPTPLHMAGPVYFWCAFVLGLVFLGYSILLACHKDLKHARGLFWLSITYLPLLFLAMVLDKN